ncbi:MAG: efflux transporter outer membrane subunit [Magnetococcales bacterium]|nr:efflux transporter outer membrane subunit [Magnetococcales bacterium]
MSPLRPSLAILFSTACLWGCALVGMDYRRPEAVNPPTGWHAALPHAGSGARMTSWWEQFQDQTLTRLIQATLEQHPSLNAAQGAIEAARAALTYQQSADQPQARSAAQLQRAGNSPNPTIISSTSRSVAVDASWELDLFGRVKRATEGAEAKVAARQAEWHGLKISLASETASLYNDHRACTRLRDSLQEEVESRRASAQITRVATRAGLIAPADEAMVQARVADAQARLAAQEAECALSVKGLVALTGLDEPRLRAFLQEAGHRPLVAPPLAVTTLPARLLAQRPDLAAAEQELVSANAEIGVAEGARYPRFSLLGAVGAGVVTMGSVSQPNRPWNFGPALSLPLLDGGAIEAGVRAARARHTMALANYRRGVQEAVREVESALVNLEAVRLRVQETRASARGAAAYRKAAEENLRTGGISRLALEEARRQHLEAERTVIQLEGREVQQWINLYKSLGGGWESDTPSPQPDQDPA